MATAEAVKRYKQRMKSEGRCVCCGKESRPAKTKCQVCADKQRDQELSRRYGLSPVAYADMLDRQNRRCAICGQVAPLVVDHDHSTGEVRELLCNGCNAGLGQFGDSLERLLQAASYLRKHALDNEE